MAIAAGADVKVVQRMLGHADATMTLNTYAERWPDRLGEVSDAISAERELALHGQSMTARPLESPQAAANHDSRRHAASIRTTEFASDQDIWYAPGT